MKSFYTNFQGDMDYNGVYYQIGDTRTTSKLQATILANGNIDKVQFHYYDSAFDSVDWTVDPEMSLTDMIDLRARQIRESHDYVALWYSGGYDSETILDSFIKQNLKLDELIILRRGYYDHWSAQGEQDYAIEAARRLKTHLWPNLYINEVIYKPEYVRDYYLKHKEDWIMEPVFQPWLSKGTRSFGFNHNPQIRRALEFTKRADVEGCEKPRLDIVDGWWCYTSNDATQEWQMETQSIQFYTTPQMPLLEVKQAWEMVKWLENMTFTSVEETHTFVHKLQSHKFSTETYRDWNYALSRVPVRNKASYYTIFGNKTWYLGHPTDVPESNKLKTWLETAQPEVVKSYLAGYKQATELAPNLFNEEGKVKCIFSKKYKIKPVELGKNSNSQKVII